ncbi:M1-specific T cell receptor beta chain-like [Salvelinus namaycush]|uniref:M1-specific T cell receptor beta chain-like n=1 Tax=Salvelinus namaycush TaxID=8040 RepID=UPI0019008B72|nr:M1-specific T cell receptor beta chain-like [Salvelinus namaycush]
MMHPIVLLSWLFLLSPSQCGAAGPIVLQPRQLLTLPGNTTTSSPVTLQCSLGPGISMSSYTMMWYRQVRYGGPVEFLIKEYEKTLGRYKEDLDTSENRFILQISELVVEDSGVYYCAVHCANYEAYFGPGTKLTVLDPNINVSPPTVKVLPPSTKECEDRNKKKKKTLVCVATRFYPDHVTVYWQVNNVNTTAGAGTDNKALWDKDSLYSITSRLRVPANDWHNPKNSFTCNVIFYNGSGNTTEKHTISGDLQGQIGGEITTDDYVKSTQTAKLAYSIFIAKSTFYGLVVMVMIWKFQGSSEKQI